MSLLNVSMQHNTLSLMICHLPSIHILNYPNCNKIHFTFNQSRNHKATAL